MGRSTGRSSSRAPAPAPARRAPPPAPAAQQSAMQPHQPQQQSMLGSLGSTMIQGFAFGTGSSLARSAVDSVMGGGNHSQPQQQQQQQQVAAPQAPQGVCSIDQQQFVACLQANPGNSANCEMYFQALQICQQNSK